MKKPLLTTVLVLILYSCETKSNKNPQPIYCNLSLREIQERNKTNQDMSQPAVHIKAEPQTHSDNLYEYLSDEQIERIEANEKLRKGNKRYVQNQISPAKIQSFPIGESEKDRLERELKSAISLAETRNQILKDSESARSLLYQQPVDNSNEVLIYLNKLSQKASPYYNSNDVHVKSYINSNGTFVESHYRTRPNNTINDNYSTAPNVNPYTGAIGTK